MIENIAIIDNTIFPKLTSEPIIKMWKRGANPTPIAIR